MTWTSSEESGDEGASRHRGVKRGSKRGRYHRGDTSEAKKRVITAAEGDQDWRAVAVNNGVPIPTAYGWLRRSEDQPRQRGGYKLPKLSPENVEVILTWVEDNPVITLSALRDRVLLELGVSVSTTTVYNCLDGRLYTVKKVLPEPDRMNAEENKIKRRDYVRNLMGEMGNNKMVIFIDETNVNLFLRRSQGRSRKGTRCSLKSPTSKGKNVHVIGGISQRGLVYWERRRGSYRKEDCCEWLRNMLRALPEPMSNIVVVCDNAPVHCALESVFEEEEFEGAALLRAAPYSAPINPIEECWSTLKAAMKREMASKREEMLSSSHEGVTQTEYRLQFLEKIIDDNMAVITPMLCLSTYNHVQKHFPRILDLQDLQLGDL